jgi:hypothetical protein
MFGNNFPIANQVMNGVSNGASNVGKALGKLQDSTGAAAGAAAQSPLDAVAKFIDEKSADTDSIAKAFQQGVIPGFAETLQALSPGNNATDMLSALGIDMSPQMKSGLSALINGGLNPVLLPAALLDIADMQKGGIEPGRITLWENEFVRPHTPPPPSSSKPGTRRPNGEIIACPPGYADAQPGAPKPDTSTFKGLRAMIEQITKLAEMLTKLMGGFGGGGVPAPVAGQPVGGTNPEEATSPFANIPDDVPFEEFVFLLMMAIVKDQQADIKKLTKELADNAKQREVLSVATSAAKANETAVQVMGTGVEALAAGAGGQAGAAIGKAVATSENGKAKAATESVQEKQEKLKESRQELLEKVKFEMQKLQELTTAMSNILNAMHDGAMGTIRNIK